jgi:hypothetical protein
LQFANNQFSHHQPKEIIMAKKDKAAAAAPATETAAPVEKVEKVKAPKLIQNGVTRPGPDTTTGKVWAIADSISAATAAPATREAVFEQTRAAGIVDPTAATQYGKWRKFNGVKSEPKVAAVKEPKAPKEKKVKAPKAAPAEAEPATA